MCEKEWEAARGAVLLSSRNLAKICECALALKVEGTCVHLQRVKRLTLATRDFLKALGASDRESSLGSICLHIPLLTKQ